MSVDIALRRAGARAKLAVMASDAYFPFPDGIQVAANAGRDGDHPARRLDPRRDGDRGRRPPPPRDGVHGAPPLPALAPARGAGPWSGRFGGSAPLAERPFDPRLSRCEERQPAIRRSRSRSGGRRPAPPAPLPAAAVATVSPQPGGTRPGARSESGASTNSRLPRLDDAGRPAAAAALAGSSLRPAGRPLDVDPVPPEHQQVEVDLARAPSLARLPPERPLELLERDEQRGGAGGRVRPGRARPAPRPRCGTRAGRGRRRAPWRRGARRRAAGRPGSAASAWTAAASVAGRHRPRWRPSPTYARTRRHGPPPPDR